MGEPEQGPAVPAPKAGAQSIALGVPTAGTGIAVATSVDGPRITATFSGSAELAGVEAMGAIVARLHELARAHAVREVVADVRELEFMNSLHVLKTLADDLISITVD